MQRSLYVQRVCLIIAVCSLLIVGLIKLYEISLTMFALAMFLLFVAGLGTGAGILETHLKLRYERKTHVSLQNKIAKKPWWIHLF